MVLITAKLGIVGFGVGARLLWRGCLDKVLSQP